MTKLADRYSSAVHSSNLKPTKDGQVGDVDILGAMGTAARWLEQGRDGQGNPIKPSPVAVPLQRLFMGDNNAAHDVVRMLAEMVFERSWDVKVRIKKTVCVDMAKACLAWFRDGVCKPCGGHGKTLIPGTKVHSPHDCQACYGRGKIAFESNFRQEQQGLALWLVNEMERASGTAGQTAMRALAPSLNLDGK